MSRIDTQHRPRLRRGADDWESLISQRSRRALPLTDVIVVLGHWLVSAVTFHDGHYGNDYPLVVIPWTQWLTLVFQVVPVFFLAGGYASAASRTKG